MKDVLTLNSHGLRFYASSVLIIYCADSLQMALRADDPTLLRVQCKLVDFQNIQAASHPASVDENDCSTTVDQDTINAVANLI